MFVQFCGCFVAVHEPEHLEVDTNNTSLALAIPTKLHINHNRSIDLLALTIALYPSQIPRY